MIIYSAQCASRAGSRHTLNTHSSVSDDSSVSRCDIWEQQQQHQS